MLSFRRVIVALAFAGLMAAAENPEALLTEKLAFWQQRLNLQEWKISLAMTPRATLKPGTFGQIRWDKSKKTAVISIVDASDYKLPPEEMFKDMEFTIVHELIHLELASLPRSEASRRTEEYAVNNIARALLSLHGGK